MVVTKKYMRPHISCPYYANGECSRTGCLFLTPCTAINEPRKVKVFVKITRKRGDQNDTGRTR